MINKKKFREESIALQCFLETRKLNGMEAELILSNYITLINDKALLNFLKEKGEI